MKNNSRANKGQFSIIAALLVSVILVMSVISTYTMVRHSPLQDSPQVLTAIGEMNSDIKRILDFTVGYYGSILEVTGNSTYAQELTTSYLSSGLVNLIHSHPEWNPSFNISLGQVVTRWYMPESYSYGNISITYSLDALGIKDVNFVTSSALRVEMLDAPLGYARINVTRDDGEPELGLTEDNFSFYNYTYEDSTWELINPNDLTVVSNGIYTIPLPSGVDSNSFSLQVKDSRGLMLSAFYSPNSVSSDLGIPHYTYAFEWDAGMAGIYSLSNDNTYVVEVLQNGTIKWLGQNLTLTTQSYPIPPIPVKALHVNMTTASGNQEVPFQIEDWESNYEVPLGLSNNASIFSKRNLIVFLVDHNVESVTIWWDGQDSAIQTPYAWNNIYFTDNVNDPENSILSTDYLTLNVRIDSSTFNVIANNGSSRSTVEFLRINGEKPSYGADPSYIIHDGIVRDIVQQEAEYSGDGIPNCPNMYAQIVLTFPAKATYYTYAVRTIFVSNSTRNLSDFSALQLSINPGTSGEGELLTEDGIDGDGLPITSDLEDTFYNSTHWEHHWSQFMQGTKGAGVMFTEASNLKLYTFDNSTTKTGALVVEKQQLDDSDGYFEVNPIELNSILFNSPKDLVWYGAVVTFDGEPIYNSSDESGLWVMTSYPPIISIE